MRAALAATALAVACPLFWYLAVRPMSDVPGLAAALARAGGAGAGVVAPAAGLETATEGCRPTAWPHRAG